MERVATQAEPARPNGGAQVCEQLGVRANVGVRSAEVPDRRSRHGSNAVPKPKEVSFFKVFLSEIREPMQILLLIVGVLYAVVVFINKEPEGWLDVIFVFFVIIAMATVEVHNEWRAKRALASLSRAVPRESQVLRDAVAQRVPNDDIVVGDVLLLQAGQFVAADARLLTAYAVEADESVLTGESTPVQKDADAAEESSSTVFAGTTIVRGRGTAIVTAVLSNDESQLGRIMKLIDRASKAEKRKTPLQKMLKSLATYLSVVAIVLSLSVPLLGWIRHVEGGWGTIVLSGLTLAFATIPEELPILIKAVLAIGSAQLAKQSLLIKSLRAVESLGCVTTIMTDKTGTLTENKLQLTLLSDGVISGPALPMERQRSVLDAWLFSTEETNAAHARDPFDVAVWTALHSGVGKEWCALLNATFPLRSAARLAHETPFTSRTKFAVKTWTVEGESRSYMRGAPEVVLAQCEGQRNAREIEANIAASAKSGARMLGFASKVGEGPFVFIGVLGFDDPPRADASAAVMSCRAAGITVLMVTGDHEATALSVARKVRLLDGLGEQSALKGPEIDQLLHDRPEDVAAILRALGDRRVLARATPEHKHNLAKALQESGQVVLVTGDGVNDAPALTLADVGVAMGASGTDMAKEVSAMVILDDRLSTIALGIRESRRLFDNLKKSIQFYISCKFALVTLYLVAVCFGLDFPLSPIQLILLEMCMDLGASGTFVWEPAESDVMLRPPRDPKEKLANKQFWITCVLCGASLLLCVMLSFLMGRVWFVGSEPATLVQCRTRAFVAWSIGHWMLGYSLRTLEQPLILHGLLANRSMFAWLGGIVLALAAVFTIPFLRSVMKLAPLSLGDFGVILLVCSASFVWIELYKMYRTLRRGAGLGDSAV